MDSGTPGTWTDESRHPDTRLNYANEFDLNVKGWFLKESDYRLAIMAGYQESRYSFNATGGTYIYSENGGFRNETGALPDKIKVIGYKQHFKIPYVGLTGNYRYDNFEFGGAFKYSGWVRGSDNDEHYVRQTTFRSKVKTRITILLQLMPVTISPQRQKCTSRVYGVVSQIKKGIHLFTTVVIILQSIIITGLELKITTSLRRPV